MMKVYLRIPPVADCGVGYYRQWLPLMIAREKKALDFTCHEFTWGVNSDPTNQKFYPTDKEMATAADWADLMYFARNDVPEYISQAGGIREYASDKAKKYKPIILDIDDNVHATRPYNPGYRSFHPNSPNLVWNIKSLGVFDAITCSTKDLVDYYSNYTEPEKLFYCPNSLDWKERDEILKLNFKDSKLFQKKEGEVRIGWTGSAAHWENLKHIEEAVLQILHDYPQTTFYYVGMFGDLFQDQELIKAGRIKTLSWSDLKTWPKFNRECNFDIALAPLTDNLFNRAKSNLRVLEYAGAKFTVVASPIAPYLCFKDQEEVLFAKEPEDWYNAIAQLVNDKKFREKLADNLYKRCKQDFDIRKNYKIWLDVFKQVLASSKSKR